MFVQDPSICPSLIARDTRCSRVSRNRFRGDRSQSVVPSSISWTEGKSDRPRAVRAEDGGKEGRTMEERASVPRMPHKVVSIFQYCGGLGGRRGRLPPSPPPTWFAFAIGNSLHTHADSKDGPACLQACQSPPPSASTSTSISRPHSQARRQRQKREKKKARSLFA